MRAPETIDRAVAIARGDALEGQNWAQLSPKGRDTAELGLRRVLAAGYRILGPDEVDPVSMEMAAATAEGHRTEGWRDPEVAESVVEEVAATIRTLGRKA